MGWQFDSAGVRADPGSFRSFSKSAGAMRRGSIASARSGRSSRSRLRADRDEDTGRRGSARGLGDTVGTFELAHLCGDSRSTERCHPGRDISDVGRPLPSRCAPRTGRSCPADRDRQPHPSATAGRRRRDPRARPSPRDSARATDPLHVVLQPHDVDAFHADPRSARSSDRRAARPGSRDVFGTYTADLMTDWTPGSLRVLGRSQALQVTRTIAPARSPATARRDAAAFMGARLRDRVARRAFLTLDLRVTMRTAGSPVEHRRRQLDRSLRQPS